MTFRPRSSSSSSSMNLDCSPYDSAGGNHEISPCLISPDTVGALRDIADVVLPAGYAPELCQVYGEVRRERLMECLAVLGIDKTSLKEVQLLEWREREDKMNKWIQALKVLVWVRLAEERRICSQIFAADAKAKECVLHLLNFGGAIVGKGSREKVFLILGMYEALVEVLPVLEGFFFKGEAAGILEWLGDAARGIIAELSSSIQEASIQRPLVGREISPIASYVTYYVRLRANYNASLNNILQHFDTDKDTGADDTNMMSPLGRCVLLLITHLQEKIEEKSRIIEDQALQNLFMMDNLLYILRMVKDSELKTLPGDNWIRSSCSRALACLTDDGIPQTSGSTTALKRALMDRLKDFNLAFEELCRPQISWAVVDSQLIEEMKNFISENLLPVYRSFVGRFEGQLEEGENSAKYIKYNPEDLENLVSDFFEGKKPNA